MSLWERLRYFILGRRQRKIDSGDERGLAPLISAALKGNTTEVASLLNEGADVDEREDSGRTALMHAAIFGHTCEQLLAGSSAILSRSTSALSSAVLIWA